MNIQGKYVIVDVSPKCDLSEIGAAHAAQKFRAVAGRPIERVLAIGITIRDNMSSIPLPLENIVQWSNPHDVQTRLGERIVREASPTEEFWTVWKSQSLALKAQGVSVSKYKGRWEVTLWTKIDQATSQARSENVAASAATDSAISIPSPSGCEYLPFQKAGIEFANRVSNCLIADEMGLGKTVEAIGVINSNPEIHHILVVTKSKLKLNWYTELKKWLVLPLTLGVAKADCWPEDDVVIINYDIIHKFPKQLESIWDLVICDEIQQCKNPSSRRAASLFGSRPTKNQILSKLLSEHGENYRATSDDIEKTRVLLTKHPVNSRRKLALTGTPIENRPIEIQPVLSWLQPENKRWSRWPFAKRYCNMHNNGFGVEYGGASNLDELRRILRESVMVRRLKKDVLTELPAKRRKIVEIETEGSSALVTAIARESHFMEENSEAIESAQVKLELAKISDDDDEFKSAVTNLRSQFRVAFDEIAKLRHETALAKVPAVIECVSDMIEEVGCKIIVFAHHLDVLQQIHHAFPDSVLVTGESSEDQAQANVKRFQTDPACGPFLGSIRATGEGITLTAASNVVFAEQDWVPGKMMQCEDRSHRLGQHDSVTAFYLVVQGSLDARIMHTLIEKMKVIEQALDKGPTEISSEEILLPIHYESMSRRQCADESNGISDAQIAGIHAALRTLAGVCDGARQCDGQGFSKIDVAIGHALAVSSRLSPRQAALGRRLVRKYARQIGPEAMKLCD